MAAVVCYSVHGFTVCTIDVGVKLRFELGSHSDPSVAELERHKMHGMKVWNVRGNWNLLLRLWLSLEPPNYVPEMLPVCLDYPSSGLIPAMKMVPRPRKQKKLTQRHWNWRTRYARKAGLFP